MTQITAADASPSPRWARPDDVAMLGPMQSSGLTEPTFLVRRGDGQVIQLSALLHTVLSVIDPDKTADAVAGEVSQSFGRTLTADGLKQLIETKLLPIGLVSDADRPSDAALARAKPLLSLGLRGTLIPERWVRRLAAVLAPAFHPVRVGLALAALVALDIALLLDGGLITALESVLATPPMLLVLFALTTFGAVFHELGHAAACHYSGGRPGRIGFGIYLVFPAFFTNVTDTYRLSRAARIRTDLGGLYFNALFVVAMALGYVQTGQGILLLLVVLMQVEMTQQLIPAIRLDGYYILCDVAGIPDMFGQVGPVLASLLPGRKPDPRIGRLRTSARRVLTAWVIVVVPLLLAGAYWLVTNLPRIVTVSLAAVATQWDAGQAAWQSGNGAGVALAAISLLLLFVPLFGAAMLVYRLLRSLTRLVARRLIPRLAGRPDAAGSAA